MRLSEYQEQAIQFAEYRHELYPVLGLAEEVGELISIYSKELRGDDLEARFGSQEKLRDAFIKEAGDVLWQLTNLLQEAGLTLEEVAQRNLNKLKDRKIRGVIKGSGDDR